MKEHEKYAEEVFKKVKKTYKWVEDDFPIDLWRDHRDIAIWYIQGQIEALNRVSDDNPTMPRFTPYIESYKKSIEYLKEKL